MKYPFKLLVIFTFIFCEVCSTSYQLYAGLPQHKRKAVSRSTDRTVLQSSHYKVINIKDGDTIVILADNNTSVTIRLSHIDCPEKTQDFGTKAKQFVSIRCLGKMVRLKHDNKYDRNHRLLAEIILPDGKNLNKELVKNGLAWHYKKYSDNTDYHLIEQNARQLKTGIWSDPDPKAPWEWRKEKRR